MALLYPVVSFRLGALSESNFAERFARSPSQFLNYPVQLWKAKFGKEIVSQVVECTLTVKPPRYSAILDLDRKIRDFELPRFTQEPLPENGGLNLVMSHYMPKNYREFSTSWVPPMPPFLTFTHKLHSY